MKDFKNIKKTIIGSDHAGFELKSKIIEILSKKNIEINDVGCDNNNESFDYPDFISKVAEQVSLNNYEYGIAVCGSGNGACMTANKYKSIRAALVHNTETTRLARAHNDANILCMGNWMLNETISIDDIINIWIDTEFEAGRHQRRVNKIKDIENQVMK